MNILLLYPKFPDTFWSYKYALRFISKRAVSPPLGLLTVAAMLPADFNVRLVDLNVTKLRAADLDWADMAFVSAMAVQQESAREVIARCRAAGVKIVAGGPLFSSQPEAFAQVDHLVLNEGELTVPAFLADLAAGKTRRIYRAADYADMHRSPTPRFELVDMRRYVIMPIQCCRGCPFDCEFCDVTAQLGHRPRLKTVRQILTELDRLKELRWRGSVFFVDDNLIGNKRFLKTELLPALIEWQKRSGPMIFNSQVSINLADDPELLELMGRAGFCTVFVGIETPDSESLLSCNKRQNVNRDLLADVHRIQAAGIQVQGGFILGFDHDVASIFQRQIDFIQSSGIVTAMVGLLQAMPGTRLYDRLKRDHRLRNQGTGDNVAASTNIIPVMDIDKLRDGYRRVLHTLYSPRGYYQRLRTFLRTYRRPDVREPISFNNLRAFARSTIMLGVVGRERFHYWRLLLWTLLHRPRLFPLAVYLAIIGQHYRRVCQGFLRSFPAAGPTG